MKQAITIGTLAVAAALASAAGAWAEPRAAFDSGGSGPSVLERIREAGAAAPAVGAAGEVRFRKAFWGRDGRWCDDGVAYDGGPCDTRGGWDEPRPRPRPGPGGGRDGARAALRLCDSIFHADDKLACLREVRAGGWFQAEAVQACATLFHASDKVACVRIIAGSWYEPAALRTCATLFHADDKLRCLRETAGGSEGPYGPGPGVDAAMRVCEGLFHASDKLDCLAEVRRARYFSTEAVGVCSGLFQGSDKIACLRTVADRPCGPEVARICGGLFHASDKIRCLDENSGR